jgi:hypothetical protein
MLVGVVILVIVLHLNKLSNIGKTASLRNVLYANLSRHSLNEKITKDMLKVLTGDTFLVLQFLRYRNGGK